MKALDIQKAFIEFKMEVLVAAPADLLTPRSLELMEHVFLAGITKGMNLARENESHVKAQQLVEAIRHRTGELLANFTL